MAMCLVCFGRRLLLQLGVGGLGWAWCCNGSVLVGLWSGPVTTCLLGVLTTVILVELFLLLGSRGILHCG